MKNKGFTLAEVLITLVIIGVIAAMTVPSLMSNTNEEEFRSAFKKAISSVNQALTLNFALDGLTAQDYTTSEDLVNGIFKQRMNIIGETGVNDFTYGCAGGTVFTTADGMIFCVAQEFHSDASDEPNSSCDFLNTTACTQTGEGPNLWIDVNGERKPNKLTISADHPKDVYIAQIFAQRVIPYGDPAQGVMYNRTVGTVEDEAVASNTDTEDNQLDGKSTPEEELPEETIPDDTDIVPEEPEEDLSNVPDEDSPYYDLWDPKEWPTWKDFLRWAWNTFVKPWFT